MPSSVLNVHFNRTEHKCVSCCYYACVFVFICLMTINWSESIFFVQRRSSFSLFSTNQAGNNTAKKKNVSLNVKSVSRAAHNSHKEWKTVYLEDIQCPVSMIRKSEQIKNTTADQQGANYTFQSDVCLQFRLQTNKLYRCLALNCFI